MCIRIQASHATVKAVQARLQDAYRRDDVRVVRRIRVRLELLTQTASVTGLCARWGLSPACLYDGQKACMLRGLDSLVYRHSGGGPETLTPSQNKRLGELIEAGPMVGGCAPACWHSVLLRVRMWRACGVLCNRHDVGTLLHHMGFSFHKARFGSEHLDAATRLAGLQDKWPAIVRAAKRCNGMIRFEAEASLAQWGSCSSTWARRGQPPEVPTSGKRKGSKVFGALDSCSGRLCLQGIEGRLNAARSHACLPMSLAQTTAHLFLLHDGARSHTSASPHTFLAAHPDRRTAHPFPSYAPDDNPMAYLWKKTKQRATHHKYCKECAALTISVEKALAYFVMHPAEVLGLFGRYCEESDLELKQAA